MAPVWLPLLLLHIRLQLVACHLPQQKGKVVLKCFFFLMHSLKAVSGKMRRTSADAIVVSQTRRSIEKVLEWENSRLYHKVRHEQSRTS